MAETQPSHPASAQQSSIDHSQPSSSSSSGRLETLLCSPYWPLGSSFFKLLNFPSAFRNNFLLRATSTIPHPTSLQDLHPKVPSAVRLASNQPEQIQLDLDGLPIDSDHEPSERGGGQSDGNPDEEEDDDDHALEELLIQPHSYENRNQPSLSDRLTEPPTWNRRSYGLRSCREYHQPQPSRPPSSSIPRNTHFHIKGLADLKRSNHPPEPFRTSSNLIECNDKLHPWGSKRPNPILTVPQPSDPYKPRPRLSGSSQRPSNSKKRARDRYQESDGEHDDRRVSERTRSQRRHWSSSHQSSEHYKQKSLDPPISNTSQPQGWASSAPAWKKLDIQAGSTKDRHTPRDFREEVADRERRWMQEFLQYDVARTVHTRSISPFPSSHRRSPSRHLLPSDKGYYTLTQIAPDVKEALHRAVFSWINRFIAEALFRLALWLEEKQIWAHNEWGSIRVDQLAQVVDMTYERGLNHLLWKCHSLNFMDLLQKPIQSGIFFTHKNPQNDIWYIRFCKDYQPLGLLYRPIIKGCRRHLTDSKTQQPIQAGKFVRQYIMSYTNEDDLLYLFKDDKDPMGCLSRAEKDGVIELTDPPFDQGPAGNCRGTLHDNKTRYNKFPIEHQYIRLKPYWLSNKEIVDYPLLSSPTTTAQTCNTAQHDEDDLLSSSTSKTHHQEVSNRTEKEEGESHVPAIDRRNSDNTSVSLNTTCTTTDTENPQRDRPSLDAPGEAPLSHRSDGIESLKTSQHHGSHSSHVDELVNLVIEQLRRETPRRRKY